MQLAHLSNEKHEALARLLQQAQDCLAEAAAIVRRRLFTEQSLYARGVIQQALIDPLNEVWSLHNYDASYRNPIYPAVNYGQFQRSRRTGLRRKMRQAAPEPHGEAWVTSRT